MLASTPPLRARSADKRIVEQIHQHCCRPLRSKSLIDWRHRVGERMDQCDARASRRRQMVRPARGDQACSFSPMSGREVFAQQITNQVDAFGETCLEFSFAKARFRGATNGFPLQHSARVLKPRSATISTSFGEQQVNQHAVVVFGVPHPQLGKPFPAPENVA